MSTKSVCKGEFILAGLLVRIWLARWILFIACSEYSQSWGILKGVKSSKGAMQVIVPAEMFWIRFG